MGDQARSEIDQHVGRRLRHRRLLLRWSQERLGAMLDVSFQQVQKYERGTNRLSASRLFELAGIMGVGVTYFFQEMPAHLPQPTPDGAAGQKPGVGHGTPAHDPVDASLVEAYRRIRSPRAQQAVHGLVLALAEPNC